jgi:LIVCS family branched-chain amino acid:cation transporter
MISKIDAFAASGFTLLQFGIPINLFVILALLIYGLFRRFQLKECIKAALIICINIPIAILYFYLGVFLMGFNSN